MAQVMEGFEDVAAEGELQEDGILGVEIGGRRIVVVRRGGRVYALGAVCTHLQGDLALGWLEGDMIRCPLHNSGFDVRTGEAVKPPARAPEPVYDVKVEAGRVWVSRQPRKGAGSWTGPPL